VLESSSPKEQREVESKMWTGIRTFVLKGLKDKVFIKPVHEIDSALAGESFPSPGPSACGLFSRVFRLLLESQLRFVPGSES
jgi:hypothetical protein